MRMMATEKRRRRRHRAPPGKSRPQRSANVQGVDDMSRFEYDEDEPYVVIERHSVSVAPFLIGIALGAGAALLLAPRSGAATRRDIRRRAVRVRRAAERAANDVTNTVVHTFQDARRKVEEQI